VLLLTRAGGDAERSAQPRERCGPPAPEGRPYADDSPFNVPIAAGARVDPRSEELVADVAAVGRDEGFVLSVEQWTVPVYEAGAATQRFDVRFGAEWADGRGLTGVPVPPEAEPDPEDDAHLVVVDRETGCEWDFWGASRAGDGLDALWGARLPLAGSGVDPRGLSARASGFALLAGLVFPEELRAGRIRHALVFNYPHVRREVFVAPATSTDGRSTRPTALAMGTRLQLDPALDLESLGLRPHERTIARALQEYGMILADSGGAIGLYAAHPQSLADDAYAGLLPPGPYAPLDRIPLERLRVVLP